MADKLWDRNNADTGNEMGMSSIGQRLLERVWHWMALLVLDLRSGLFDQPVYFGFWSMGLPLPAYNLGHGHAFAGWVIFLIVVY